MAGRGVAAPHRHRNPHDVHEQTRIGKVACDWAYFKDREGGEAVNVLIGIDHHSSRKFALICSNKLSDNPDTLSRVLTVLQRLGHFGPVEL